MLIVLLGPPGSGKGTQSKLLSQRYNLPHFSTGEMLREEIRLETPLGQLAGPLLADGNFISDEIAIDLIRKRLPVEPVQGEQHAPQFKGGLFDGFPRTLAQAVEFDRMLHQIGTRIDIAIELHVPEPILQQRLNERYVKSKNARPEDSSDAIPRRMKVYRDATLPITAYYKQKQLLTSIDGTGTPQEVFQRIEPVVNTVKRRR